MERTPGECGTESRTVASDDTPSWLELTCRVPAAREEEALARLATLGWEQCAVEQPLGHEPTEDDWRLVPQDAAHVLVRVYTLAEEQSPEQVAAGLAQQLGELAVEVTPGVVRAEDWLASWREQRTIVPLTEGWAIAPPWLSDAVPAGTRAAIIDPGWAFGAGDHATTRDSAILLLRWLRPGDRVLDLGAGSGVLSILARLAGSGPVTAVEIDPIAAREIPRNAALNGVAGIDVAVGDAAAIALCERYDLVLLNIGAGQAKLLRTRCDQVSCKGARLIVSGLAQWSVEGVMKEYSISGWIARETLFAERDWATLVLLREAAV